MKSILISIKPKWCAKMMNGDKKVEVRSGTALYKAIKKLIDEYGYADIYVYCTKGGKILGRILNIWTTLKPAKWVNSKYNGKVIFKFRCYKVEEIKFNNKFNNYYIDRREEINVDEITLGIASCLSHKELNDYLKEGSGYAIHISDLEIFDKPKELSEFYHYVKYNKEMAKLNNQDWDFCKLTKAPQSYCFIEVGE